MLRAIGGAAISTLVWFAASGSLAAQTGRYVGRPVADVLRELQNSELRIIFSSDLVPRSLLVRTEPRATSPHQIARLILAPHGLSLRRGPRNTLLVVSAEPGARPSAPRAAPAPAPPDQQPPATAEEGPVRIEERVDVAERVGEASVGVSGVAVTPQAVRETAGALENVLQVLALLPGTAAIGDDTGKLAVRGTGPEHNMILMDGVQIHNPHRLGEIMSSFLNPAAAASVQFDTSGLDARHGGRLSSVTVVETRDGRRDRSLSGSGSAGLTSGDILLEGRLPGTAEASWWMGTRGTYYRPLVNSIGDDAVPGFGDVQFKVSAQPTSRTRMSIFGLAGRETSREYSRQTTMGTSGEGDGSQSIVRGAEYTGTNRLAAMNLWWTPSERLVTATTVSAYAHDARDYDPSLVMVGVSPFERDVRVNDLAARHRVMFAPARGHLLEAGIDLHRIRSQWNMTHVKPQEFWRGLGPSTWGEQVDYSLGPVHSSLARSQAAAWLQHRLPIVSTWAIEPGLRLQWNSLTGDATWQPRARLSGRVGTTTVWTGFAEQAQAPSHETLQGFDYFHLTAPGVTLRDERSRQVVVGVEQPVGALTLRAEAYQRRFDRLLVQRLENDDERARRLSAYEVPDDIPPDSLLLERRPTIFPESTGRGRAAGVEVLVRRDGRRVSGALAYAFSRATRESYGVTFPFDFDRPHALSASLTVQVVPRVRVSGSWQRATGFPVTPVRDEVRFINRPLPDGTLDPVATPVRHPDGRLYLGIDPRLRRMSLRNSERLSPYSRVDVRGTYSTLGRWELYGEILNLFNHRNYLQRVDVPAAGAIGASVWESSIYQQFQRLASFGIRARF